MNNIYGVIHGQFHRRECAAHHGEASEADHVTAARAEAHNLQAAAAASLRGRGRGGGERGAAGRRLGAVLAGVPGLGLDAVDRADDAAVPAGAEDILRTPRLEETTNSRRSI